MKVISIWQPFSTLLVKDFKLFETRTWPAPASLIGQRIGIASTKSLNVAQKLHCEDPFFQKCYDGTCLENWTTLPRGYLLGTAILHSVELMTEELLDDVSDEEKAYGWWELGGYAWRMRNRIELPTPIMIRGQQGIFDWNGNLDRDAQKCEEAGEGRAHG